MIQLMLKPASIDLTEEDQKFKKKVEAIQTNGFIFKYFFSKICFCAKGKKDREL